MKTKVIFSRYSLLWVILSLYLLPIVGLIAYNFFLENNAKDWNTLSIGVLLASVGTLILFWFMTHLSLPSSSPETMQKSDEENSTSDPALLNSIFSGMIDPEEYRVIKLSLEEAQQTQIRLLDEIDLLTNELNKTSSERKEDQQRYNTLKEEYEQKKHASLHHLEQQQRHIRELQGAVAEQKAHVEKKQQQIGLLESKVNELTHEIKTLLHFAESRAASIMGSKISESTQLPPESQHESTQSPTQLEKHTQPNEEPFVILKRCIDIAQKMRGSQRFGSQLYSFLESPADSYSLDLRRLCDRLRGEINGSILLYSPKDNQLLFASNQIKELTGWSPEKFVQNFEEILHEKTAWRQGVDGLGTHNETQAQLSLNTRFGHPVVLRSYLGMIPAGIFRNHVIAVLENCQKA